MTNTATDKTLIDALAADDRVFVDDTSASGTTKSFTPQQMADFVGSSSIPDGDKGDITTSSSGSVWTINSDAVTYDKMQDTTVTDVILGRETASGGTIEEITCTAAGRALIDDANAAAQRTTLGLEIGTDVQEELSGASLTTATVATNDKVLIQDTDDFNNLKTVTAQSIADLASGGSGDVTGPVSSTDNAITRFDGTTGKIIQNSGATIDDSGNLTANNVSGTNTGDQTITLTGDVTGSGTGSFAATISSDSVTYDKMQDTTVTDVILGRQTAGGGTVEEVACTAAGRALIDDASASDQRTTLGLGTIATQNANSVDVDGGAIDGVTIGTNSAVTELEVDNINVNGNTISAVTGAINITPAVGSAIVLDGTINVDAGVITGATSVTSTNFVGAIDGVLGGVTPAAATVTDLVADTMQVDAGTGTATYTPSGYLNVDVTSVGNVGTGIDTLITYTLPANTLANVGDGLEIECTGTGANNANAKTLRMNFGGTTLATNSLLANNDQDWVFKVKIVKTGSNAQFYWVEFTRQTASATMVVARSNGSLTVTDTSTIVIETTGSAVANDDVVQTSQFVKFIG
jgi:hypothetical protein